MCVLIFSTTISLKVSHSRETERDMIKHAYWSSCKELLCPPKIGRISNVVRSGRGSDFVA